MALPRIHNRQLLPAWTNSYETCLAPTTPGQKALLLAMKSTAGHTVGQPVAPIRLTHRSRVEMKEIKFFYTRRTHTSFPVIFLGLSSGHC